MLKTKRAITIFLFCVVFGLAVKFSYFYLIGDEGLKYFSIIKGIVQLHTTDNKIAKISNTPEEFIFNVKNEKAIEQMVKEQGFEIGDGTGAPFYKAVKQLGVNKYTRISMRKFSSKYTILTYTTLEKND